MTAAITIQEVIDYLETIAPKVYQESYDNCGLLIGNAQSPVTKVLVTLDCLESIVDEAITTKCNLIVAHHPILFKGIKKLNGKNYVERTLIKAIKNDIAIYAIHTNLDSISTGVNKEIANRLNLINTRILKPLLNTLLKLTTFVPLPQQNVVLSALHEAGAGNIGLYKKCSFKTTGEGTFEPTQGTHPTIGKIGRLEIVQETKIEVILPIHLKNKVLSALFKSHPYEEVSYYLHLLENENQEVGSGMIGELAHPLPFTNFLELLKQTLKPSCIRHTQVINQLVKKVAICGGAGSFLIPDAITNHADIFITADMKYHEFFDADQKIIIADIGHYESEQFTKNQLASILTKKFTTFVTTFSTVNTNPIIYY